ncbi:hypothetical protein GCM10009765_39430 [Fodinicola feengrottensis]|uniref:Tetratricopeptide repeat protein n=1 Tax=Fodinicola feengrottensis TaxID=435914 RepID=A0ABP4TDE9_9ACTN
MEQTQARQAYRDARVELEVFLPTVRVRSFAESARQIASGRRFEGDQWDACAQLDRAVLRYQRVLTPLDPMFVRLRAQQVLASFAAHRFGRVEHLAGPWIRAAAEISCPAEAEVLRQCQEFGRTAGASGQRRAQAAEAKFADLAVISGPRLLEMVAAVNKLSGRLRKAGRWADAVALRLRFIARMVEECGADEPKVAELRINLALDQMAEGETAAAVPLFEQATAAEADVLSDEFVYRTRLGYAFICEHQSHEAERILTVAAGRLRDHRASADPATLWRVEETEMEVEDLLARCLWQQGKVPDARKHFEQAYHFRTNATAKIDEPVASTFNAWIFSLERFG